MGAVGWYGLVGIYTLGARKRRFVFRDSWEG